MFGNQIAIRGTTIESEEKIENLFYYVVAYWYQLEPHKPLPELPPVKERLPRRWPEHGLWG